MTQYSPARSFASLSVFISEQKFGLCHINPLPPRRHHIRCADKDKTHAYDVAWQWRDSFARSYRFQEKKVCLTNAVANVRLGCALNSEMKTCGKITFALTPCVSMGFAALLRERFAPIMHKSLCETHSVFLLPTWVYCFGHRPNFFEMRENKSVNSVIMSEKVG